jgi:Fe-S-cluster containining protein
MSDRCHGECCESFFLGFTPQQLQDHAETADRLGIEDELSQIAGMVVPIGEFEENPGRRQVNGSGGRGWFYTCRHLTHAGDCGIYETRPAMCRNFPRYERADSCPYPACQSEPARTYLLPASYLAKKRGPVRMRLPEAG